VDKIGFQLLFAVEHVVENTKLNIPLEVVGQEKPTSVGNIYLGLYGVRGGLKLRTIVDVRFTNVPTVAVSKIPARRNL